MKLNKTFGRVATTLVATAMLASLAAPAYAATVSGSTENYDPDKDQSNLQESITLNIGKKLQKPAGVAVPDETYEFEIGSNMTFNGGTTLPEGTASAVSINAADATIDTAAADMTTANAALTEVPLQDTVQVDVTNEYTDAGVYTYEIKEKAGTYPDGTEYAGETLTLTVYVQRKSDNTFGISGYSLKDSEETKTSYFTNEYAGGSDGTTEAVTVNKIVDGAMATNDDLQNKHFDFTVTVNGDSTKEYYITVTHREGESEVQTAYLTVNQQATIPLGHGETFVVNGLTDEQVTVAEGDHTGFTGVYISTTGTKPQAADTDAKIENVEANSEVTFYNTKDATTPTGIVMNVAPYVLLVVVAAAGCFVFLRKRRED